MFREKFRKFHFIGIGGIGMSGIAKILLDMGYEVSGSDVKENDVIKELKEKGAVIYIGHDAKNVIGKEVVVYSSAISNVNEELLKAKELGLQVISRGDMLADLFRMKEGIAISGSHGKTTTTSMISHISHIAGLDPTVLIGGILQTFGSNAVLGKSELLISEADESDGSFLKLNSVINVVTNIDKEHIGYYKDYEDIKEAFVQFINNVPFYGASIVNIDDAGVRSILSKIHKKIITYGIESGDFQAKNIKFYQDITVFDVFYKGIKLNTVELQIPGMHNVYNALASIAVSTLMEIEQSTIREALKSFRNAKRRIEFVGEKNGNLIYDDYGHHPTEIKSVYEALKSKYKDKNIIVVFQPHRYSRTYYLFNDFVELFKSLDNVFLMDIYGASEENTFGVFSSDIAKNVAKDSCAYLSSREELFEKLNQFNDSVIVFMGAGSIGKWAHEFVSS
ncbi:MAG: UDP-N-acetylmuramate--L-alanine ligase [Hydrogenobaculum sp.]